MVVVVVVVFLFGEGGGLIHPFLGHQVVRTQIYQV